jgi:hypothetical protein
MAKGKGGPGQGDTKNNGKRSQEHASDRKARSAARKALQTQAALTTARPVVLNGMRINDPLRFISGEIGQYAFPGNNQPSVQLDIYNANPVDQDPFLIVKAVAVQDGHPLQQRGIVGISIPVKALAQEQWKSQKDVPKIRVGQDTLHDFCWEVMHGTKNKVGEHPLTEDDAQRILDGVHGVYTHDGVEIKIGMTMNPKTNTESLTLTITKIASWVMFGAKPMTEIIRPGFFVHFGFLFQEEPKYSNNEDLRAKQEALVKFVRNKLGKLWVDKMSILAGIRKAKEEANRTKAEAQKAKAQLEAQTQAEIDSYSTDLSVIFNPELPDSEKCVKIKVGKPGAWAFFRGKMIQVEKIGEGGMKTYEDGAYGVVELFGVEAGNELFGLTNWTAITMNMLLSPTYYSNKSNKLDFDVSQLHRYLRFAHFGAEQVVEQKPAIPSKPNRIAGDAEQASSAMINLFLGGDGIFKSEDEESGKFVFFRGDGEHVQFAGAEIGHPLGIYQQAGTLKFGAKMKLVELQKERPDIVGLNSDYVQSVTIMHVFLRKEGKEKYRLGVKGEVKQTSEEVPKAEAAASVAPVEQTVATEQPQAPKAEPKPQVSKSPEKKKGGGFKAKKKPKDESVRKPRGARRVSAASAAAALADRFGKGGSQQASQ